MSDLLTREEDKYFVPKQHEEKLIEEIRKHLKGGNPDTQTQWTVNQSLYLDSDNLDCYRTHLAGKKKRFKMRFRRYSPNGVMWQENSYLEIKIKDDDMSRKVRYKLPDSARYNFFREGHVDYSPAIQAINSDMSKEELKYAIDTINRIMENSELRRQVTVTYRRRSYSNDALRVTIDDMLRYDDFTPIDPKLRKELLKDDDFRDATKSLRKYNDGDYLIMEVKHVEKVPEWLKQLLKDVDAEPERFSKYFAAISNELKKENSV